MGPADVAERLNTTPRTIYTWLREGTIPGYKVGSSWFIIRDELKDKLREGSNPRHETPVVATEASEHQGD